MEPKTTMERKTAHDFDQELLILFDAYVHGALDRRGFLDKAAKYAVGGVTAAMLLDQLSPKFLEAQVVKPEDPRIKVQSRRIRLAEGLRQDARLPGAAGQGRGQAAGRPRHPREPRAEPAHRGHRPPAGARQLRGVRAGCAVPARRLSGRRRQGPRGLPQARSGEDARGLRHGSRLAQGAARNQRQDRRRRLLLRRRHGQLPGHARARARGRRARSTAARRTSRTCRRSRPRS